MLLEEVLRRGQILMQQKSSAGESFMVVAIIYLVMTPAGIRAARIEAYYGKLAPRSTRSSRG